MFDNQDEAIKEVRKMCNLCIELGFYWGSCFGKSEQNLFINSDKIAFAIIYSHSFGYSIRTTIYVFEDNTNPNYSNSYCHITFNATPANILQLIEDCRAFVKSSPVTPK